MPVAQTGQRRDLTGGKKEKDFPGELFFPKSILRFPSLQNDRLFPIEAGNTNRGRE